MTDLKKAAELYCAYSQGYATEANRRRTAFYVDLAFAIAALVLTTLIVAESAPRLVDLLTRWLPLAALFWLGLREIEPIAGDARHRREAVNIQEQFDLLFWKDSGWSQNWNRLLAGEPVPARTVKQMATANPDQAFPLDYWVNTDGLPNNDAALFRIEQTAAWGAVGHRRYAKLNRLPAIAGALLVAVVSLVLNISARDTAVALFAIAPFLVGRIQSAKDHDTLADRREDLERHLQAQLDPKRPSTDADVRTAQDEIYRLRIEHRRIPSWLYDRHAADDRSTIDAAIEASIAEYRKGI